MKKGDIVKYSNPANAQESDCRFTLLDDPAMGRVDIQLLCSWSIKPIERVDISDICPADDKYGQFVSHVTTEQTGGNIMVDLVHLVNGKVLGVTDDSLVLYPSEVAFHEDTDTAFPSISLVQHMDADAYEIMKRVPDYERKGEFIIRFTAEYTVDLLTLDDGKVIGIDGGTVCLYASMDAFNSFTADRVIESISLVEGE